MVRIKGFDVDSTDLGLFQQMYSAKAKRSKTLHYNFYGFTFLLFFFFFFFLLCVLRELSILTK